MQSCWKVGSEEAPEFGASDEFGPPRQCPGSGFVAENECVNKVWDKKRPRKWYGAEEEEYRKEDGYGHRVPEYSKRLETTLDRHVQWRPAYPAQAKLVNRLHIS